MTTSSPSSRLRIRLCLLTRFTCNEFCLESMSTIRVEFITCTLQVFIEFDPVPLASASLAQVHAATTHDGKKVAVKVQHGHLLDTSVIDITTVDLVVNALNYIFPTFDYRISYDRGMFSQINS
ncbi:putative ABC1 protein [Hordeum vulgare]|nr:putative ABC1 protein [Hordeum vulgare]